MESEHFKDKELRCKCCGINLVRESALKKLEKMRHIAGDKPIRLTSAYRCPRHEAAIGGSFGPHPEGAGFDIDCKGTWALRLVIAAYQAGFGGIGINQKGSKRFIHVDDLANKELGRMRPWIWSY